MYEDMTYENILDRMLERIQDDIDKREGSMIFNALAPAAFELQLMYMELDNILNEMFADTESMEYLKRRAAERGLSPYPATYAILRGRFTPAALAIPIGSRFNCRELNYIVKNRISPGEYSMECETVGIEANKNFGEMTPIEYIEGLEYAKLIEILIPGKEEEKEDDFRERYFASFDSQAFGGNIADYKEKVNALPGVGGCKVYPVWNGGGTVKVVILSSEWKVPTVDLINTVQTALDPEQNHGDGVGLAPIGHIVTVEGVTSFAVTFSFEIIYMSGYGFENLQEIIKETVEEYLISLTENWDAVNAIIVRRSQIEAKLLNIAGIVDVLRTQLNGKEENLLLKSDEIPVIGDIYG